MGGNDKRIKGGWEKERKTGGKGDKEGGMEGGRVERRIITNGCVLEWLLADHRFSNPYS